MRRLRVLVLMHPDCVPPDSTDGYTAQQINAWKTEFDVVSTLRASGHDVRPLGVQEEIKPVRDEIDAQRISPERGSSLLVGREDLGHEQPVVGRPALQSLLRR